MTDEFADESSLVLVPEFVAPEPPLIRNVAINKMISLVITTNLETKANTPPIPTFPKEKHLI